MEASATEVQASAPVTKSPKKKLARDATKVRAKRQGTKTTNGHPSYSQMIKEAIVALKDRKGSSRVAILKYICGRYQLGNNGKRIHSQLRLAIKKGITSGTFALAKGAGVNGSFKLGTKVGSKTKVSGKPKKRTLKQEKKGKAVPSSPKKLQTKKVAAPKKSKKKMKADKPKPKVSKPKKTAS